MKLLIIGAGNVGGFLINNINQFSIPFEIIGLLDDDTTKIGKEFWGIKILGAISELEKILIETKKLGIIIAIANPIIRKKIITELEKNPQIIFPNFIHKNSWISNNVSIGKGNIIYPGVTINYETVIHDFAIINMNTSLGHNCILNNYVSISPGVNLGGFTTIDHTTFLGIGSCTKHGINIGSNVNIGAGTVIINDIPDYVTVVGNPVKIIKFNNLNI